MAKVSIIIPVKNTEEISQQCLESLVHQTLSDIEIICVNMGGAPCSDEEEAEAPKTDILQDYAGADSRIILLDEQDKNSYGWAINAAMMKASGEYVGIVWPRDYVALDAFENLYQTAKEKDLDFIRSDYFNFKAENNGNLKLSYVRLAEAPEEYNKVYEPAANPAALNFVKGIEAGIYKKSFLEELGIHHSETPGCSFQDEGFLLLTSAFGRSAMIVDKAFYYKNQDEAVISDEDQENIYALDIEYDAIRDQLMEHPEIWRRFRNMYWKRRFICTDAQIARMGEAYREEYCANAARELNAAAKDGFIVRGDYEKQVWDKLHQLMKNPDTYGIKNGGGKGGSQISSGELATLRKESRLYNDIINSNSYKLGFGLTKGVRWAKESYRAYKKDPEKFKEEAKKKLKR